MFPEFEISLLKRSREFPRCQAFGKNFISGLRLLGKRLLEKTSLIDNVL